MTGEETKRRQELARAAQAAHVLDHPIATEVLDTIERDVLRAWEATTAMESDKREKLWMWYLCCRKFRNTLKSIVDTGTMAEIQLEEAKKFSVWRR